MTAILNGREAGQMLLEDRHLGLFRVWRPTMTSPEILNQERDRIFSRCWIYVGHESEVARPGDFLSRNVAGRPLVFNRGSDGVVRVFHNTCPHRGAEVCREPLGNAKRFTCFYHGWSFNNTGELISLPGEDAYGPGFDRSLMGLVTAPRYAGYKGFWFVNFDRNAMDLDSYLAGATEYLDLVADQGSAGMEVVRGTQQYSIRANWKLLVENSIDGYHALTTHATYFTYLKDLGTDLATGVDGVGKDLGNGHAVIDYRAPWGRPVAYWEPRWGEAARVELDQLRSELIERHGIERAMRMAETNRNLLIFPNLIINDIQAITIRTFYPLAPDYQEVSAWALAPRGEADSFRARRLDSFLTFLGPGGFATPDDLEALEVCQRGFDNCREIEWSDISRGMLRDVPRAVDEEQMRAFWRRWNQLMIQHADTEAVG